MRLEGRVALVTGGARGIGKAIALAFAREGAAVAIVDIAPPGGSHAVVDEIRGLGGRALAVQADVTDEDQVCASVLEVEAQLGPIDILVNNAGVAQLVPLAEMTAEQWDRMIRINLRSVFLCTRYVLPGMISRGRGKVINMSSHLGFKGRPTAVHYAATKGAINAMTKALALEVAAHGVQVNGLAPGPISVVVEGDERVVLAADAVKNRVEFLTGEAVQTLDPGLTRSSIQRIRALGGIVYPGHDRPFRLDGEHAVYVAPLDVALYAQLSPYADEVATFRLHMDAAT